MENLNTLKAELVEKAKNFSKERASKVFTLKIGEIPEKGDKVNKFNIHSMVIAKAIESLIKEGTTKTTKEIIMDRAVKLGLYDIKPSKSNESYIFNWNKPCLELNGFLD